LVREAVVSASLRRKLIRHPQNDQWDKQIEDDLEDGTLDNLIEDARGDHRKGRTKPLP
jgi:hypothetical protein